MARSLFIFLIIFSTTSFAGFARSAGRLVKPDRFNGLYAGFFSAFNTPSAEHLQSGAQLGLNTEWRQNRLFGLFFQFQFGKIPAKQHTLETRDVLVEISSDSTLGYLQLYSGLSFYIPVEFYGFQPVASLALGKSNYNLNEVTFTSDLGFQITGAVYKELTPQIDLTIFLQQTLSNFASVSENSSGADMKIQGKNSADQLSMGLGIRFKAFSLPASSISDDAPSVTFSVKSDSYISQDTDKIEVMFNKEMAVDTVDNESVYLTPGTACNNTPLSNITHDKSNLKSFSLRPLEKLKQGQSYSLCVNDNVEDLEGNYPVKNIKSVFHTVKDCSPSLKVTDTRNSIDGSLITLMTPDNIPPESGKKAMKKLPAQIRGVVSSVDINIPGKGSHSFTLQDKDTSVLVFSEPAGVVQTGDEISLSNIKTETYRNQTVISEFRTSKLVKHSAGNAIFINKDNMADFSKNTAEIYQVKGVLHDDLPVVLTDSLKPVVSRHHYGVFYGPVISPKSELNNNTEPSFSVYITSLEQVCLSQ